MKNTGEPLLQVPHCQETPLSHLVPVRETMATLQRGDWFVLRGCCKAAACMQGRRLAHESAIYARNDPRPLRCWSVFMAARHIVRGTPRSGPFSPNGFPPFPRVPAVRDHRPVRRIHASRLYERRRRPRGHGRQSHQPYGIHGETSAVSLLTAHCRHRVELIVDAFFTAPKWSHRGL